MSCLLRLHKTSQIEVAKYETPESWTCLQTPAGAELLKFLRRIARGAIDMACYAKGKKRRIRTYPSSNLVYKKTDIFCKFKSISVTTLHSPGEKLTLRRLHRWASHAAWMSRTLKMIPCCSQRFLAFYASAETKSKIHLTNKRSSLIARWVCNIKHRGWCPTRQFSCGLAVLLRSLDSIVGWTKVDGQNGKIMKMRAELVQTAHRAFVSQDPVSFRVGSQLGPGGDSANWEDQRRGIALCRCGDPPHHGSFEVQAWQLCSLFVTSFVSDFHGFLWQLKMMCFAEPAKHKVELYWQHWNRQR